MIQIGHSQTNETATAPPDTNLYRIIKTDGGELIGRIHYQDAREILISTTDNREIYVPQHVIKEIVLLNKSDFNAKGSFVGEDRFATRYFITTNGLPIKKGEHYVQWNIFGPDLQLGVGNNFGVGVMTSWVGVPIIGSIKKSWELNDKSQFAIGALVGTGSWIASDFGGVLPFATLSFGDRTRNLAISAGYGALWFDDVFDGRALTSVAGMMKISTKVSLVFDSFIVPATTYTTQINNETVTERISAFALFIPGVRWHQSEGKAVQFGFTGLYFNGSFLPFPIPMIQLFRSL
jgi:hypothetical protein